MKKSILNLGKALDKTEQNQVIGGQATNFCYGPLPFSGCGTCAEYHALPRSCQMQVMVSHECFPQ